MGGAIGHVEIDGVDGLPLIIAEGISLQSGRVSFGIGSTDDIEGFLVVLPVKAAFYAGGVGDRDRSHGEVVVPSSIALEGDGEKGGFRKGVESVIVNDGTMALESDGGFGDNHIE
jgi:hypothetical protein